MVTSTAYTPPETWCQPDDWYALGACVRVFGPLFLFIAVAPWLVEFVTPWVLPVLAVLIGAYAHKITMVMHDCSHDALFRNAALNLWVGRIGGTILGSDFHEFSRMHWVHHSCQGEPVDPQAPDYVAFKQKRPGALLWHLINPLFLTSMGKLIVYNLGYGPSNRYAESQQAGRSTNPRWLAGRLALTATLQVFIAALATNMGRMWWLVLLYPVSAATFGLLFSRARSFCEHISPPDLVGDEHVRTHLPNLLDRFLMFDLNFNYHVEHHLYPNVISRHLPKIHGELERMGYHTTDSRSPGILATVQRRMAQAREIAIAPSPARAGH